MPPGLPEENLIYSVSVGNLYLKMVLKWTNLFKLQLMATFSYCLP